MNIPDFYGYLVRARRDLWTFLEGVPDDLLARPVLPGRRLHCLKDLVLHVPMIEDSWLHEDILRDAPVWDGFLPLVGAGDGPFYAEAALPDLLAYWRAVEARTLPYLASLTPDELAREVLLAGSTTGERLPAGHLLWHVMQHEVRHTAQMAALARQMDLNPPQLDLIRYLPLP